MATTIRRDFAPADRYLYDFRVCSISKGWAQLDTGQDASYYGQWINPEKRQIFCYCEGDLILTTCDTDAELVAEVERIREWNTEQGHRFIGIDDGMSEKLNETLLAAGLADYLHKAVTR